MEKSLTVPTLSNTDSPNSQERELAVFCLTLSYIVPPYHNLADEIEQMLCLCSTAPANIISTSATVCNLVYDAESQIITFQLAFAAPKIVDCIKACAYVLSYGHYPENIECSYEIDTPSEQIAKKIWCQEHNYND